MEEVVVIEDMKGRREELYQRRIFIGDEVNTT